MYKYNNFNKRLDAPYLVGYCNDKKQRKAAIE